MSYEAEKELKKMFSALLPEGQPRRIVFWYDSEETFSEEIDNYELDDVKIIKTDDHHYFHAKYLVEKEWNTQNILMYLPMARPHNQENPLLDILLYSEEFYMDAEENVLKELGLDGADMRSLVKEHHLFFRNKARRTKFMSYYINSGRKEFEEREFRLSILATLTKADDNRLSSILFPLFAEWAIRKEVLWDEIKKYGDVSFFWEEVGLLFGYGKAQPTIEELCVSIFKTRLHADFDGKVPKNWQADFVALEGNTVVFLNQWMNTRNQIENYQQVSKRVSEELQLEKFTKRKSYEFLMHSDLFSLFDEEIIASIVIQLLEDGLAYSQYETVIMSRRNTYWFDKYALVYKSLLHGVRFFRLLKQFQQEDILMGTAEDIWQAYADQYFLIDTYYRDYYTNFDQVSDPTTKMIILAKKLESHYKKNFIVALNNRWSELMENHTQMSLVTVENQVDFYQHHPNKYIRKNKRVFVIISDAFRYEIGAELHKELSNSHRFEVVITQMMSTCPSYTALGMAALLPHDILKVNDKGEWFADSQSTKGTNNRQQVLANYLENPEVTAIQSKDFMRMTKEESREYYRGKQLNYIYHNQLDAVGDNAGTEDRVFVAAKETVVELQRIVQRLAGNLGATNIYLTADHGFLYERENLQQLDKVTVDTSQSLASNKRFMLDKKEISKDNLLTFQVKEALEQDLFVHVPYGDTRMALQGNGSKFVHGGASIQELMVPLIKIKTEQGNVEKSVDIQLLTSIKRITSSVTYLEFLQVQPVAPGRKENRLNVFVEDVEGNQLSNELEIIGEFRSEEAKNRVLSERLILYNQVYDNQIDYYMVLLDYADETRNQKIPIKIDVPMNQTF